jgi:hypothetical protein
MVSRPVISAANYGNNELEGSDTTAIQLLLVILLMLKQATSGKTGKRWLRITVGKALSGFVKWKQIVDYFKHKRKTAHRFMVNRFSTRTSLSVLILIFALTYFFLDRNQQ